MSDFVLEADAFKNRPGLPELEAAEHLVISAFGLHAGFSRPGERPCQLVGDLVGTAELDSLEDDAMRLRRIARRAIGHREDSVGCAFLIAVIELSSQAQPAIAKENRLVRVPKGDVGFSDAMAEFRDEIASGSRLLGDLHGRLELLQRLVVLALGEIAVAQILEANRFFAGQLL